MGRPRWRENPHCKNGRRMWLKWKNRDAVPRTIIMACGDIYNRAFNEDKGYLFVRYQSATEMFFPKDTP